MIPAENQNGTHMAVLLELGATISDAQGDQSAPVALVLETYGRNPTGKHQCLEFFAQHGIHLPDTPPMAVHRGRIDLLEDHLRRDPDLLHRTFSHQEIYPPELGCHADESLALHTTPLAGATLLHLCVDNVRTAGGARGLSLLNEVRAGRDSYNRSALPHHIDPWRIDARVPGRRPDPAATARMRDWFDSEGTASYV